MRALHLSRTGAGRGSGPAFTEESEPQAQRPSKSNAGPRPSFNPFPHPTLGPELCQIQKPQGQCRGEEKGPPRVDIVSRGCPPECRGSVSLPEAHRPPGHWCQSAPCPQKWLPTGCRLLWVLFAPPSSLTPLESAPVHLGPTALEGTPVLISLGGEEEGEGLCPCPQGRGWMGLLSHMGSLAGGRLFLEIHCAFRSGLR